MVGGGGGKEGGHGGWVVGRGVCGGWGVGEGSSTHWGLGRVCLILLVQAVQAYPHCWCRRSVPSRQEHLTPSPLLVQAVQACPTGAPDPIPTAGAGRQGVPSWKEGLPGAVVGRGASPAEAPGLQAGVRLGNVRPGALWG